HPHPHATADGAHAGAVHFRRERDLVLSRPLAGAGILRERPRRRRARLDRGGAHGVVRVGVRRRIGQDRALSSHRGDGAPARLMDRLFITLGALSALLAVAAGAFGAHALRERLSASALDTFQTGAQYQMYHALALLAVGILLGRFSVDGSAWLSGAGWLFLAGSILFSGSLYLLA